MYCGYFLMLLIVPFAKAQGDVDYYWRNYYGTLPLDAFVAGVDVSGNHIYIGQAVFVGAGLLPGTLHERSSRMNATANVKVLSTNENVYILCTKHHENFEWTEVNNYNDILKLRNMHTHFVVGGMEPTSTLYIAKAFHEGDTRIGKVFGLNPNRVEITFPNREGKSTTYQSFMLLTYVNRGINITRSKEYVEN